MSLQIEHQVELVCAHRAQERRERPRRQPAIVHDHLVEPRMALNNRARLGLNRPRDMRGGPSPADPAEQRERPHHIADRAEQNDQNPTRRVAGLLSDAPRLPRKHGGRTRTR